MPLFLQLTKQVSATLTYSDPGIVSADSRRPDKCRTSEDTAEESGRVGKLILLVIPPVQGDKNAFVVNAWDNLDARAGEFGAQLIVSGSRNAFLGTVDVESRDRWVVRGLLRKI